MVVQLGMCQLVAYLSKIWEHLLQLLLQPLLLTLQCLLAFNNFRIMVLI